MWRSATHRRNTSAQLLHTARRSGVRVQIQALKRAIQQRRAEAVASITGRAHTRGVSQEELQRRLSTVYAAVRPVATVLATSPPCSG
jgi:hypothetical protein